MLQKIEEKYLDNYNSLNDWIREQNKDQWTIVSFRSEGFGISGRKYFFLMEKKVMSIL